MNTLQALDVINANTTANMGRVTLEAWIRSGKCPFASYVRQEGKGRGAYIIIDKRLYAYVDGEDLKN